MDLEDIEIKRGRMCESIVTTFHEDGTANAAPMGVLGKEIDEVILRVHKNTDTFGNILRTECCVINIVFDPLLFLKAALFGRNKGAGEIELDETEEAGLVHAPYLKDAEAYIQTELKSFDEIRKKDMLGDTIIGEMTLRVLDIQLLNAFPIAPNRGFNAGIELAIALSRDRTSDVQKHLRVIKKTLPVTESLEIEELVEFYLKSKS
jgi:hypothetical protein